MACGACGARKAGKAGVKYEVKTSDGKVTVVDDMGAVRRTLTLGGGGTWKTVAADK